MSVANQLKPFLEPESVAIIGAHPSSGEWSFNIAENLAHYGYRGRVYPVNSNCTEILGRKCYSTIAEVPTPVDLAIIVVSRTKVPEIIKQCAAKGIRAAIVVSQGFADAGDEEGKNLQQQLTEVARQGGVRVLGPNSLGTANAFIDFGTSFGRHLSLRKLPVALISQTGFLFSTFGRFSLVGKAIDLGNACDVGFEEALEYFEQDPETKVIVLHIEGIRNGRRFIEAVSRVAKRKRVLAFKTARSQAGAEAAQSHTGSLVGRDEVWNAVFKQFGITRVNDMEELEDVVRAFCYLPTMGGRRIAVVTNSGGAGIVSADACARYNMEMSKLSPATMRKLKDMSPSWFRVGNPVDFWPIFMATGGTIVGTLRTVLSEVLNDHQVDALVLFAGAFFDLASPSMTEVIIDMVDAFPNKPIIWCPYEGWQYEVSAAEVAEKLEAVGKAAVFNGTERAVRALSKLADYSEYLRVTK